MIDLDKWAEIAATLGKNKLRTALTALGVFWGIFMLVVLLAVGDALDRGVHATMFNFAPNAIYTGGRRTSLPWQGLAPGRFVQFKNADIAALGKVPGIEDVAPRAMLGGWRGGNIVKRGTKTATFNVTGDHPAFRKILKFEMIAGRWLSPRDVAERRKVAVIGDTVAAQLFGPTVSTRGSAPAKTGEGSPPVGEEIEVRGVSFTVIGVMKPQGKGGEVDRQAQTIFVPLSTFQQAFNGSDRVNVFAMTMAKGFDVEAVEREVRATLARRHQFDPEDDEAVWAFNTAKESRKIELLFVGIRILMWVVGGFTLMAGVLGVSNIMLIAVKERTKELGVRKALGATPGAIVRMVLAEALALTALAGYLGLLGAVAFVELAGPLMDGLGPLVTPLVDFRSAIYATLLLVAGGALAGVIPALHAARIKPVEALRAE